MLEVGRGGSSMPDSHKATLKAYETVGGEEGGGRG